MNKRIDLFTIFLDLSQWRVRGLDEYIISGPNHIIFSCTHITLRTGLDLATANVFSNKYVYSFINKKFKKKMMFRFPLTIKVDTSNVDFYQGQTQKKNLVGRFEKNIKMSK